MIEDDYKPLWDGPTLTVATLTLASKGWKDRKSVLHGSAAGDIDVHIEYREGYTRKRDLSTSKMECIYYYYTL